MSKERVTLTVTCNADGSQKLLLIVIGKSLKSRCFKNVTKLQTKHKTNKHRFDIVYGIYLMASFVKKFCQ